MYLIIAERHYNKISHAEFHPNRSWNMKRRVGIHLRPEANMIITEMISTKASSINLCTELLYRFFIKMLQIILSLTVGHRRTDGRTDRHGLHISHSFLLRKKRLETYKNKTNKCIWKYVNLLRINRLSPCHCVNHKSHGLTWEWTRASAVRGRRLTAWATYVTISVTVVNRHGNVLKFLILTDMQY